VYRSFAAQKLHEFVSRHADVDDPSDAVEFGSELHVARFPPPVARRSLRHDDAVALLYGLRLKSDPNSLAASDLFGIVT
jgi:hypothetical protein